MSAAASFRDPDGFCFVWEGRVFRAVASQALEDTETFLGSTVVSDFGRRRQFIPTRRLSAPELVEFRELDGFPVELIERRDLGAVFEHERVEFPSYPYEWAPEMLFWAGRLTLDLAQAALAEGYGLKDATPYNVLFRGPQPVFVDLLSFERRHPGDPVWKPHAQFCRTFLLPLLAHKYWGVRLADVFSKHRDGLETNEVYRFCGPVQRFLPPFLTLVTLPNWLSRKVSDNSLYREHRVADPEKARFILDALFNRLRRALERVAPPVDTNSVWSGYMGSHSYTDENFRAKEAFVRAALAEFQTRRVLDVGANTGHFSVMAAEAGAQVVAIDTDLGCAGALWRQAQQKQLPILPLVVDLARPSAAKGWRNAECASFLDRATGAFDGVLMLAVLHHLLVTERIPLDEVLDLAADLTTGWLLIEFVGPEDEMFRSIARGRDQLHAELTPAVFEAACRRRFQILRSLPLGGSQRRLYLLKKAAAIK